MTVFESRDNGMSWDVLVNVDRGAVSYSAMQVVSHERGGSSLYLLYERSNSIQIVFDPDEIVLYRISLGNDVPVRGDDKHLNQ